MKKEQVQRGMVVYDKKMLVYRRVKRLAEHGWAVLRLEDHHPNWVTHAPLADLRPLTARERGDTQ